MKLNVKFLEFSQVSNLQATTTKTSTISCLQYKNKTQIRIPLRKLSLHTHTKKPLLQPNIKPNNMIYQMRTINAQDHRKRLTTLIPVPYRLFPTTGPTLLSK